MSEKDDAGVETKVVGADDSGVKEEGHESSEHDIDYQALYLKEVEEKENYKKALTQKRQLRKKPEEETVVEDEDENKPLTRKDLQEVASTMVAQSKEEQLLAGITDVNKRNLVKFHLENSIKRTGNSEADLAKALAITDAPKLQKINKELARAAENKPSSNSSAGGSSEKTIEKTTIAPELKIALENKAKKLGVDPKKFIDKYLENRGKTPVLG